MTPAEMASLVASGARSLLDEAGRLGLTWGLRVATVVDGAAPQTIRLILDNDADISRAMSMIGVIPAGQRVYVLRVPPAGAYVVGYIGALPGFREGEPIPYTVTGTFDYTDYPGLRAVKAQVQAGGGAGAGVAATGAGEYAIGGCGGGGEYREGIIEVADLVALGAPVAVTVGVGGAGVAGGVGAAGSPSSVGAFISTVGGLAGGGMAPGSTHATSSGGGGGTGGVGGYLNVPGCTGSSGQRIAAPQILRNGESGASYLGGTARWTVTAAGGNGNVGVLWGGGGNSGLSIPAQAARTGGDGAQGIVFIIPMF